MAKQSILTPSFAALLCKIKSLPGLPERTEFTGFLFRAILLFDIITFYIIHTLRHKKKSPSSARLPGRKLCADAVPVDIALCDISALFGFFNLVLFFGREFRKIRVPSENQFAYWLTNDVLKKFCLHCGADYTFLSAACVKASARSCRG